MRIVRLARDRDIEDTLDHFIVTLNLELLEFLLRCIVLMSQLTVLNTELLLIDTIDFQISLFILLEARSKTTDIIVNHLTIG